MPVIYRTKCFRHHWGWDRTNTNSTTNSEYGIMQGSQERIDEAMNAIMADLNEDGWEIKAAIPLVASEYQIERLYNNHGMFQNTWGGGAGYGATFSDGVVLLCQRAIHLTDEEYAERQFTIHKQRVEAEQQADRTARANLVRSERIDSKSKGIFKGSTYTFGQIEYATENEAIAAREAKAKAIEDSD